jgi:hypothetical protein
MTWKRQVFLILILALLAVGRPFQNASAVSIEEGSRRPAKVQRPAVYVARVLSVSAEHHRPLHLVCNVQYITP